LQGFFSILEVLRLFGIDNIPMRRLAFDLAVDGAI